MRRELHGVSATHFDTFGLPASVDVDLGQLEQKYRALSLQHHPDRVASRDARERRLAAERSAEINEGFKVLKDPVRRAFYLLKLAGVDLEREDSAAQRDMPLEFLEEVMERREALEQARHAKDLSRARAMASDVERAHAEALSAAQGSLRALAQSPGDDAALKNATHQLGRVRYFARFLEEVEAMEEEALG